MSAPTLPENGIPGLAAFDLQPRTRIVFGPGKVRDAGEIATGLRLRRVLLVTDHGIVKAGHASCLEKLLRSAGLDVTLFTEVEENPTSMCVQRCVEAARSAEIDGFVALGGGSSMDTAKGCNFVLTNGGEMKDYWGWGKASKPMLPLMAIPTTAGTGSECQSYALISDAVTHQKMACGDPKAAAAVALLDPELTLSQPAAVTACTGIDALAHALESAVTKRRTPVSQMYSQEAFRLLAGNLEIVLQTPENLAARAAVQLGAAWAGAAIENSMLGAAHSAANPLTAHFGIVHGQAVGAMLPKVVQLNGQQDVSAAETYRRLALSVGWVQGDATPASGTEAVRIHLEGLLEAAGLRRRLSALGVTRKALPEMAAEASHQWTAQFNPVTVDAHCFERLYADTF